MVVSFHFCFGMAFTSGSFYLYLLYTGRTAFPHLPEWPGGCTGNASFRTVSVDPTLRYNRSAGGFPDRDIPLYSVRAVPPFRYHFIVFIIYEYPKRYKAYRKMFGGQIEMKVTYLHRRCPKDTFLGDGYCGMMVSERKRISPGGMNDNIENRFYGNTFRKQTRSGGIQCSGTDRSEKIGGTGLFCRPQPNAGVL